ncbi:hypothetical protein EYV94_25455 [Puteibacter caeruleilacunae]|nr:hypothetical protein EYV94_25455 [Puteibacter caeruleilacunae]
MMRIIFLFLVVLVSCQNNTSTKGGQKETQFDSIKKQPLVVLNKPKSHLNDNDVTELVKHKLPRWVNYWERNCPDFDIEDFSAGKDSVLKVENIHVYDYKNKSFQTAQHSFDIHKPYLKYSSDSTKVLSLYSAYEFSRGGESFICDGREWIGQVYIEFLQENKSVLVYNTFGTIQPQDGFWIDNYSCIVVCSRASLVSQEQTSGEIHEKTDHYSPFYMYIAENVDGYIVRHYYPLNKMKIKKDEYLEKEVFINIENISEWW